MEVEFQGNIYSIPKHFQITRFKEVLYVIPESYKIRKRINKGVYGKVVICRDKLNNRDVVVKKCEDVINIDDYNTTRTYVFLERMYKEIEVLNFFKKNPSDVIVEIIDSYLNGNDVYLIFEYVVNDLSIQFKLYEITDDFRKTIIYKMLRSLRLFQKSGIVHRDIKPSNILVDRRNNTVKICDFGLSTKTGSPTSKGTVVSRWYRPLELFLESKEDSQPYIDMWSFGCVVAELYLGEPLFSGKNYKEMVCKILSTIGRPDFKIVKLKGHKDAIFWIQNITIVPYIGTMKKIKDSVAIDLILRCLWYDPDKRITAEQAMQHALFDDIRKDEDFEETTSVFKSSFDDQWKPKEIRENLIKLLDSS